MVSRRRLLLGSAAALSTAGLGLAGTNAWASPQQARRELIGGGMPLPDGSVCQVDYLTRAAWGADPTWLTWAPEYFAPQTITVHHTATGLNPSDPAAVVRAIYRQQALPAPEGVEGFGDIGYHLMVDQFGVVYEARYSGTDGLPIFAPGATPHMVTGAHIGGWNSGNIGICLVGDFTSAPPTAAAQQALVTLLAGLAWACHIDPLGQVTYVNPVNGATRTVPGISGHRDWAATECPGGTLYPLLDQIRAAVAARLTPPPPENNDGPRPTSPPQPGESPGPRPTAPALP